MVLSQKLGHGFFEILTEVPLHFCPVLLGLRVGLSNLDLGGK